eukprot:c11685_g1_i1 orf=133-1806(+)
MADVAAPVPQQANPALPGAEQVASSSEVKEDTSKAEKWPFAEPQPIREDQVKNAVNFLSHPKVRGTPMVQRFSFLERKGLTREEIEEAFRRCPDPPTSEAAKATVAPEGKVVTAPLTQTQSGGIHQAVVSPQPQPAQQYMHAPSSAIVPARSGSHWSQLILGAGLIAAAGAGTGYLFQKVLAPKLRAWLREVVQEENKPIEPKGEKEGKSPKLSPLEEAVAAAAAAANAAAAAATEVASTSREVLKMQAEEWQHLRGLIKSLDIKTEELKTTLTIMSKNSQDAQGQIISSTHAHAEEPLGAYYKGSVKTYQRSSAPAEQVQIKQGIQIAKSMGVANGEDRSLSNAHSATFNNNVSHSEEEPWWRRKKVEVETYTSSPKQHVESAVEVSEIEAGLDKEIGSAGSRTIEYGVQSRGGPLGRQGWVPPPVPQTVMPGAASAIRYQKPATVDEPKPFVFSEEKEVDSQLPAPLLETGMQGSPSAMRLRNPVVVGEAKPSAVAEEKAMDVQTSFELSKMPEVAEVAEITSVDKEIPFSSIQEWGDDGAQVPVQVSEANIDDL